MAGLPSLVPIFLRGRLKKHGRNTTTTCSRLDDCEFFCWTVHDQRVLITGSITCGLYINITLHDYLRTIVNLNRTNSTWCLVGAPYMTL